MEMCQNWQNARRMYVSIQVAFRGLSYTLTGDVREIPSLSVLSVHSANISPTLTRPILEVFSNIFFSLFRRVPLGDSRTQFPKRDNPRLMLGWTQFVVVFELFLRCRKKGITVRKEQGVLRHDDP